MPRRLLTLPDVPPSVCYPSGRHRQRRGPKPGGQRNLDPRIGRGRASRHGDCQHRGGRGPAVRVRSTQVKCRFRAVITNKPKMLSGLNQKVCGQVQGLQCSLSRMTHHRPKGTTLPRSDRGDERSNPRCLPAREGGLQRTLMRQWRRDEGGSECRSVMDRIEGESAHGRQPLTAKAG